MARLTETIEVTKELAELGDGIAKFLKVLKKEGKDGFDFTDIPPIVQSAMGDLLPALLGIEDIADEFLTDRSAFVNASMVSGAKMINAVLDE